MSVSEDRPACEDCAAMTDEELRAQLDGSAERVRAHVGWEIGGGPGAYVEGRFAGHLGREILRRRALTP